MQLEPGMLARSKAGHDKNCIYVIICVKDEYVYLADGQFRPVCRAKKKKPEACAADQKGLQYLGDR
ncbi:MAG: KOW domain-containing RNA-binding protein [Mediterraneibacter gnavus]